MLNFFIWNQYNKNLLDALIDICSDERSDFIILIESQVDISAAVKSLNNTSKYTFNAVMDPNPDPYFLIFYNDKYSDVQIRLDNHRVVIYQLFPVLGLDITLVAVHLPSKLRSSAQSQALYVRKTIDSINNIESDLNHQRTIVVGDFNLNPYDDAMFGADEFNSVIDLQLANRRPSRIVHDDKFNHFYNPMWSIIGDRNPGPPGTYYYDNSSEYINNYWNSFDQVILRPSVGNYLSHGSPRIIYKSDNFNLLNKNGIPNSETLSDHLPIVFSIENISAKEAKQ